MRGSWLTFFLSLILLGCSEDDFPSGLYGYQVERLLSGGDEKVWLQAINSINCQDSVRLLITSSQSSADSISVFQLNPLSDCSGFDTLQLGNANASVVVGSIGFTDSLIFSDQNFWIIQNITSTSLSVSVSGTNNVAYRALQEQ